jgi:hypothetical protein
MKKVKLALEQLAVESFETDRVARQGGTVHAHLTRPIILCGTEGSCNESCTCPIASNCNYSCPDPC